eukprot:m.153045 g.153045  ORF g.153045 m.153045 type:complete len:65 (-) comp52853_c0_seq6:269-463(-)
MEQPVPNDEEFQGGREHSGSDRTRGYSRPILYSSLPSSLHLPPLFVFVPSLLLVTSADWLQTTL